MSRVLLCVVLALALAVSAVDVTLDASTPLHAAAKNLWGIFYEEINHAAVGGLYSQLIQNPLFQSNTTSPWASSGCTSIKLDSSHPLNGVNTNALAAAVSASADCTITNAGYYGIAAKPSASYTLSFYALSLSTSLKVVVGLRSSDGSKVYAQETVSVVSNSTWNKFEATLDSTATAVDASAQFFITIPHSSSAVTVYVDCFLLFPAEGWQGLSYIRQDLGDMLAAMHPTFMRFPGGNYVEGNNIAQIMHWKDTVGPVESRPGHQGTWGYWSPDHFGLLEELEFIETVGAQPVWVVNCGMTFGGMVPVNELDPYIQEALDGIEFISGNTSTTWGAYRAKLGHPEPFTLNYIAIGNEEDLNGYLPDYKTHYPLFYTAIKAAYPDITVIANTIQVNTVSTVDLQEIHDYTTPEAYWGKAHEFDNSPRSEPIFLSEYAVAGTWVQSNNTKNFFTMRAALGEAVFMNMLERNSDVVLMACYAPLFVNDANHGWDPDAITYNSYQAFGSPSYWNQVMFGSNAGEQVLKISYDDTNNPLSISATSVTGASTKETEIILKAVNFGSSSLSTTFTVTLPSTVRAHKSRLTHGRSYNKHAASAWTLSPDVDATIMTASDLYAKNSFTTPENVAPVESTVTIVPTVVDATHVKFDYELIPNSIQILVLTLTSA